MPEEKAPDDERKAGGGDASGNFVVSVGLFLPQILHEVSLPLLIISQLEHFQESAADPKGFASLGSIERGGGVVSGTGLNEKVFPPLFCELLPRVLLPEGVSPDSEPNENASSI